MSKLILDITKDHEHMELTGHFKKAFRGVDNERKKDNEDKNTLD